MPNEAQSMRQLGIQAPDPSQKIDRYNNAKMTFTELDKQLFIEVCQQHGFQLDTVPEKGKTAMELNEFKLEKRKEDFLRVAEFVKNEQPELFDAIQDELYQRDEDELEFEFETTRKSNIEL